MLPKVIDFELMSVQEVRDFISEVEKELHAAPDELKLDFPPIHRFSKGVYSREIFIPKGTLVIGKIHKHENLNILSKGKLSLLSIEGVATVEAPFTVVSPPGVKRLAYAHEDSVWTTIHGTDETDLEKIEEEFIVKSYDELIGSEEVKCLGSP